MTRGVGSEGDSDVPCGHAVFCVFRVPVALLDLLDPASARPPNRWRYEPDSDLATLAAAYGYGLIRNHPFIDENKRIGFVTANMFLILNGHEIEAPEPQVVDMTLRVADGSLDETEFATWIRVTLVPYGP